MTGAPSEGSAWVEANYRWDRVLDRYERFLAVMAGRRLARSRSVSDR